MAKSLWQAENQSARLAGLTSGDPAVRELPVRRDVRSLGQLLGQPLKEQVGELRGGEQREELRYALAATIKGISAGLRNTG